LYRGNAHARGRAATAVETTAAEAEVNAYFGMMRIYT
jgi:hypothetical protein